MKQLWAEQMYEGMYSCVSWLCALYQHLSQGYNHPTPNTTIVHCSRIQQLNQGYLCY